MFYEFQGFKPVVKESAFVHQSAVIIGNVLIGEKVYIGPGAVIRGDWGQIIIEDGCNVQENCVVHMFPGVSIRLEEGAHVGHGAIIHGANLGRNVLIGMNAVIMDRSTVGAGSIVGALSFVKADTQIPERSLVVGNPARIIKEVSDTMLNWKSKGTELYQELPGELYASLKECEPLAEEEANRPKQEKLFQTWNEQQGG
ncbi:acyltransferase [Croceimicrobium hydrocarbonivorans]|uniref:Transferase hexapeptide repeat family protein n=1 Tax=Croceimicrobium hydrocarbonivorans TaxID=2761580 RepID=A0A7H0VJY4_9FLAO|nr:transferase hexapeptide repeat family protein [Croceimicrobium hydrocarbonivorans]QNR26032.1 transferase hexapeptide repeat family protein [Croceimicrobium hydrocarbonivorans]